MEAELARQGEAAYMREFHGVNHSRPPEKRIRGPHSSAQNWDESLAPPSITQNLSAIKVTVCE